LTNTPVPADRQICDGVFRTYADAIDAIPKGRKVGFDHSEMASYLETMADYLITSDYAVAFWLRSLVRNGSAIFDLGGNIGVAYYSLSRIIPFPTDLDWRVCDVPEVNRRGVELASRRNCSVLSFTDRYQDAEGCDTFLALGAVQYIDTDLASMLAALERKPTHLLIHRLPLVEKESYVTLQDLGKVVCAYRIFNRRDFLVSLTNLGYRVIDEWECPESFCRVRYHPETAVRSYTGLYLTLQS
jgi:putative methyltransferase (TIGR04325 family)